MALPVATNLLSEDEKLRLQALEATANRSNTEKLELAVLYIMGAAEDRALSVLTELHRDDPGDALPRILWSYCALHHLMDASSLHQAESLLRPLASGGQTKWVAAANLLLAQIVHDLDSSSSSKLAEEIALLEASVEAEPSWVYNHYLLSLAYRRSARLEKAEREHRAALENYRLSDSPEHAYVISTFLERSIAGRQSRSLRFLESEEQSEM